MKQTSELLNELFAAWDFSPEGIVIREDAPQWVHQCLRYTCAGMNETKNQDILLLLHRFSAFALKNITKADSVDAGAYLSNAIILSLEDVPDRVDFLVDWLSYDNASRSDYVDYIIADSYQETLRLMLHEGYMNWSRKVLGFAKDFILSVKDDDASPKS